MAPIQQSDKELLDASLKGDAAAFACIVKRYQSLVCAVAYNGTGDLTSSEDLAQETFVTAWRSLPYLRDWRKLSSWLCGIARNLARDHRRRRQRDLDHLARPLYEASDVQTGAPTPRDSAERTERERLMWCALEEIPEPYRVPLILYYREGHSVRAVAEALELSEDAVKQRRGYQWMIFGPLAWAIVWAVAARDWTGAGAIVAACTLATLLCSRAVDYSPLGHTLTVAGTCLAMACFAGPLIAVKWPQWVAAFGGRLPDDMGRAGGILFSGLYACVGVGTLIIGLLLARRMKRAES